MTLEDLAFPPTAQERLAKPVLRIALPWPDSRLLPNRRMGRSWQATHGLKLRAQQDGYAATRAALGRRKFEASARIAMLWIFAAPDRRTRDLDGLYSACKHYQDGIARALGIDDSAFRPVSLDSSLDPKKKGFVIVEVS